MLLTWVSSLLDTLRFLVTPTFSLISLPLPTLRELHNSQLCLFRDVLLTSSQICAPPAPLAGAVLDFKHPKKPKGKINAQDCAAQILRRAGFQQENPEAVPICSERCSREYLLWAFQRVAEPGLQQCVLISSRIFHAFREFLCWL